jgi:hypothetical protein
MRRGVGRRGPGVVGMVARTAVVAGTATVVNRGINNAMDNSAQKHQAEEQAQADAYLMQDQLAAQQAQLAAQQEQLDAQQQAAYAPPPQYAPPPPAYAPPPPAYAPPPPAAPAPDRVAQLKELAGLRDAGVLTEAEFQQEKARILSQ